MHIAAAGLLWAQEKDLLKSPPSGAIFGALTQCPPRPFALMGLQTSPVAGRATAAGGKGTWSPR